MKNKFIIRNNKRADYYNINNKIINGVPIMTGHNYKPIVWIHTRLDQLRWDITTNGIKKNNDNTTTPMFIGLNKTTQKTRTPHDEGSLRNDKVMFSSKCILISGR
jgi:Zn-dependent M28 family amino/carboxypeptidase